MLLQAAISVVTLTGIAGSDQYSRRSQVMPLVGPAPALTNCQNWCWKPFEMSAA
jgi:hypothetical protein